MCCVYIGEKVVSNLARFVVIVWCFVVLVLTQSYTANLTSFLTVQRLKPEVTTVNELIENKEIVGYQNGSFVLEFLIKKGFQGYQLKPYNSAEECHNLLINGTSKGGIAAAFDEVAYLKVIISQYCNKYAIVEPSFKSSGFGFVSSFLFLSLYLLQNYTISFTLGIFIARII